VLDWKGKYEVYTGLAGVAVAYLRAGLFWRRACRNEAAAQEYLQKTQDVAAACLQLDPRSNEVSFMCGTPGYLAILCVTCFLLGESEASAAHLKQLLSWSNAAVRHSEDELLFGRAGYLYALLWVRHHCGADKADFDTPLQQVVERLVETGRRRAAQGYSGWHWPLMWHCFDEPYVGAAHGLVGVLAMLLHCFGLLCPESQQLVSATIERLLHERFESGNLPIVLGGQDDEHVHWCHGAPGLPGLALAARAAQAAGAAVPHALTSALVEAAVKAGDVVWQRGLILKGNGLCHGIAGNAYTFLSLRRLTADASQLSRAQAFAAMLSHGPLQEAIAKQPDSQRKVPGMPDSPRSLLEGSAGVFCYLLDLADPDSAAFPGWEL